MIEKEWLWMDDKNNDKGDRKMKTFNEIIDGVLYSSDMHNDAAVNVKACMKEAVKVALQTLCNRIAVGDVTAPKQDIERILKEMEG